MEHPVEKEPTPQVTQLIGKPEIPVGTPAEEQIMPSEMSDGSGKVTARADRAVRPQDKAENWQRQPDLAGQQLDDLVPEGKRPNDLVVETNPHEREIGVFKGRDKVCNVRWMPQGRQYLIYRQLGLPGNIEQTIEYPGQFPEVWKVLGEFGVTAEEIQRALVEKPSQVLREWDFSLCPEKRTDCVFRLSRQPGMDEEPVVQCQKCKAEFVIHTTGVAELVRESTNDRPVNQEGEPIPDFRRFILRMKDASDGTIEGLNAVGIDSWKTLNEAKQEQVMKAKGMTRTRAQKLKFWAEEYGDADV